MLLMTLAKLYRLAGTFMIWNSAHCNTQELTSVILELLIPENLPFLFFLEPVTLDFWPIMV